jgi:hypothetical protein
MQITPTDIIACLGATAWLPTIYTRFTKPIITITPDKTALIGFTIFGPIFNLRLSINVDRKDTLIDFIGVEICHEDGSKHQFEWAGMTEFFSEVKNNKGENQTIQRDVVPIAIKLNTLSLIERYFKFQDTAFIKSEQIQGNKLLDVLQYMQNQDKNYHDDFLKSKEFEDYLKFIRGNFYLRAGNYLVKFYIRSPAAIKVIESNFKFQLTQDQVDSLKGNMAEVKKSIEVFIKKLDLPNFNGHVGNWKSINSTLTKA